MQMACWYPVVSAEVFRVTSRRCHSVCVVCESRPGKDKTVVVILLDPASLMFTHLHFFFFFNGENWR